LVRRLFCVVAVAVALRQIQSDFEFNCAVSQTIGFNEVGGTIPAELRQLSNLNLLDLSNNKLSGAVPTFLATLINLGELGFLLGV
jgi:Leucine-rich repeat (LRR) protein